MVNSMLDGSTIRQDWLFGLHELEVLDEGRHDDPVERCAEMGITQIRTGELHRGLQRTDLRFLGGDVFLARASLGDVQGLDRFLQACIGGPPGFDGAVDQGLRHSAGILFLDPIDAVQVLGRECERRLGLVLGGPGCADILWPGDLHRRELGAGSLELALDIADLDLVVAGVDAGDDVASADHVTDIHIAGDQRSGDPKREIDLVLCTGPARKAALHDFRHVGDLHGEDRPGWLGRGVLGRFVTSGEPERHRRANGDKTASGPGSSA